MPQQGSTVRIARFGSFEVDFEQGRLTKGGLRIRLQGQPFQILTLLLERAGQVVSREEIRQSLWSNETFVEFDDALNTAIGKLRAALGDKADNPRFLETVPRRGYRFVAPVSWPSEQSVPSVTSESTSLALEDPLAAAGFRLPGPPPPPIPDPRQRKRSLLRFFVVFTTVLVVAAASFMYWRIRHPRFQLSSKDLIVIADFVNTTGETIFDDALRQGLEIGLQQSPSVKVLPDRKTSLILRQMGHSPDEHFAGKTAIEVCQRAGGKVTVQGSIASLGTAYLVGLAAIRCDNGDPIANEQVQARHKEDVVDALGRASARLRSRLGESLPSIQRYNAPLELATTASLDALNAYGLALTTWDKKGDKASLPIFKSAVAIDPNFALAYGGLATIYHNLGETDLARESATKAYELRDRATEAEKSTIEARYFAYVTGDLEKTLEVRTLEVQNYPNSAGAYNHLGNADGALGRYEQTTEDLRTALLLDPTRANTYGNLAFSLLALNRVDEAVASLQEAARRNLEAESVLEATYWIAFVRGDGSEMQRVLQRAVNKASGGSLLLSDQSNTEAYHGRFEKAREVSLQSASLAEKDGDKETAASALAQAAVRDAEIGNVAHAQELLIEAEKLSRGREVMTLTALAMARMGEVKQAQAIAQQLSQQWPMATSVQKYWLPVIHAEIDLQKGQPSMALDDLRIAAPPLEYAIPSAMPIAPLYPAYLRGQAYLAMGDGQAAATEFGKFGEHKGMVVNYPLGPIASVQLARSYVHLGDTKKARESYQSFLEAWKDADPDIGLFKQAKAEYARLR